MIKQSLSDPHHIQVILTISGLTENNYRLRHRLGISQRNRQLHPFAKTLVQIAQRLALNKQTGLS
jgi:hypothetical protein